MIRSLWTAATGMKAQQLNIDTVSNNLANVNTNGFKKSRVNFQDLMYQSLREAGTPNNQGSQVPTGVEVGHGVRPASTQKLFAQGSFQQTKNPLDMAIEGDGFFQVVKSNGQVAYTRDGSFKRDSNGRVVTADGHPLASDITIPEDATEVSITGEGRVMVKQPGNEEVTEVGQIELARFSNPAGLKSSGRNLFTGTPASGNPTIGTPAEDGFGTISQGYLEKANVKVVEEMTSMIAAQRAYEVSSKAIKASDQMLQQANNLKR